MEHRTVVIVAYPGVQSLDVAGPFEVFAGAGLAATAVGTAAAYDVRLVSPEGGEVATESGLRFGTAALPATTTRSTTLLLPGGGGVGAACDDPRLVAWVTAAAPRARRLATVCSGAFWPPGPACSTDAGSPPTGPVPTSWPVATRRSRWTPTRSTCGTARCGRAPG